ncbi:MAG: hypothetical protein A2V66_05675 [Ignavibacteria bacterium RBG_13_36_8]|nr:MAG: hypothetical protein A2V66_05675 [Ignavibacteria bacterium RBG_13_36_8]
MDNIKKACLVLMEKADVAYLSTIGLDGFPQTRAVYNFRNKKEFPSLVKLFKEHDDDFLVYITTDTSSEKMRHIKNNPSACIYYCEPKEWHGLLLTGKTEIVNDIEIKKDIWQEKWWNYYKLGPEDPEYTILKLLPIHTKGWYYDKAFGFDLS